jgi:hypothetical protein
MKALPASPRRTFTRSSRRLVSPKSDETRIAAPEPRDGGSRTNLEAFQCGTHAINYNELGLDSALSM